MIHRSHRRRLAAVIGLTFLPSLVAAQGVSVSFANGRSNSTNGLSDISGVQATFAKPIGERPWSMRYGVSYLTGSKAGFGSLCDALVPPDGCPPEVISYTNRLTTVSAGLGHFTFRDRAVMLHSYADLTLGYTKKDAKGITSRNSNDASKFTAGIRGGLEAQWAPSKTMPFAIQLGMALEGVKPLGVTNCADCWTPFDGGFDIARSYVGVVIGRQTFKAR